MRLDFNVLWVDDQPERIAAQIQGIERRMAEHGFEFKPVKCNALADVATFIADDVFKDEVDLQGTKFTKIRGLQKPLKHPTNSTQVPLT